MSEGPATPPHVAEPPARWLVTPRGQVLVDSGPLLALFNAADHWHAPVAAWPASGAGRCCQSIVSSRSFST